MGILGGRALSAGSSHTGPRTALLLRPANLTLPKREASRVAARYWHHGEGLVRLLLCCWPLPCTLVACNPINRHALRCSGTRAGGLFPARMSVNHRRCIKETAVPVLSLPRLYRRAETHMEKPTVAPPVNRATRDTLGLADGPFRSVSDDN